MLPVRATFEKRRRAKYISHLDLMRCMTRAFKRAGVPIWYTEGFNPHAYLMFPLALSLGCESGCECMDFRIDGDMSPEEAMQRLNAVLPADLQIVQVAEPVHKHTDIAWADYAVKLRAEEPAAPEQLRAHWDAFIAQEHIMIEKKTKRGTAAVDLREQIGQAAAETVPDGIALRLRLPAGTSVNINPSLLTDAFAAYLAAQAPEMRLKFPQTERLAILCADGSAFT